MYQYLLYQTEGPVARITVNRPSVRNALNAATLKELVAAIEQAGNDPSVRVVVITGSGEKAFVAGADIAEISELSQTSAEEFSRRGQKTFDEIEGFPKPTIAAINGYALGGGCELAMACTIRIAAETAVLGQPEVKLGLIPGYGGTQRLPRLVGRSQAMRLLLTGKSVTAGEALNLGLVDIVVPAQELAAAADALAREIAANAPLAVQACIEAVRRGEFAEEARLFGRICQTEDMREGTSAFLEKRMPEFKGR